MAEEMLTVVEIVKRTGMNPRTLERRLKEIGGAVRDPKDQRRKLYPVSVIDTLMIPRPGSTVVK